MPICSPSFSITLPMRKSNRLKKRVLLNDKIQKITTPYMRFYELEALCAMGEQNLCAERNEKLLGRNVKTRRNSFWEEYNPAKKGTEHLAMYGRPFGKSLCHAWGASPIYLLGKYYLGVKPLTAGYKTYIIEPNLGGLAWMDGKVPTPEGEISVYCTKNEIKIKSAIGEGKLKFKSTIKPSINGAAIKEISKGSYELTIQKGMEYTIKYNSPTS